MIYPILKGTLEMWYTLRTTPEPHLLAKIISPLSANGTLTTRDADFESHSVTDLEAIDLCSDTHHHTRRFMTKRERCTSTKVTVGEFLVVADIRTAYAGGPDLNLEFPGGRFLYVSRLLLDWLVKVLVGCWDSVWNSRNVPEGRPCCKSPILEGRGRKSEIEFLLSAGQVCHAEPRR